MNRWDRLVDYWKDDVKFSASNPKSFEEKWGFVSSRIRLLSLITLLFLFFGVFVTYLVVWGPLSGYILEQDKSIERIEVEQQAKLLAQYEAEIESLETYSNNLRAVLLGQLKPEDMEQNKNLKPIDVKTLDTRTTKDEIALADHIQNENLIAEKKSKEGFVLPIQGVISQDFSSTKHPALDIVAKKDEVVRSCLAGVVMYAGYSKKDGYFTVVGHDNGFVSMYKHLKINLKKTGQRVKSGDTIGIVGNSGENSTGPHLHFELWKDQRAVDPKKVMNFVN